MNDTCHFMLAKWNTEYQTLVKNSSDPKTPDNTANSAMVLQSRYYVYAVYGYIIYYIIYVNLLISYYAQCALKYNIV